MEAEGSEAGQALCYAMCACGVSDMKDDGIQVEQDVVMVPVGVGIEAGSQLCYSLVRLPGRQLNCGIGGGTSMPICHQ